MKQLWLSTESGKALLGQLRKLEKGQDIAVIVWDPESSSSLDPIPDKDGKLCVTLNGQTYQYETHVTHEFPEGKAYSVPSQSLHHEVAHLVKRLEFGVSPSSYQTYNEAMRKLYRDPSLTKWRNPSEKNAVARENEFTAELRRIAKNPYDPRPPERINYIEARANIVVTADGIYRDGKLVKEVYWRNMKVSSLPPSMRKAYEDEMARVKAEASSHRAD